MTDAALHSPEVTWHVLGASVRGASHERKGLPNQDAIRWETSRKSDVGLPIVLAISDGHGSAENFRSQIGAQLAVETAIDVCISVTVDDLDGTGLSAAKAWSEENLPKDVVRRWIECVADDLAASPFQPSEFAGLEAAKGRDARRQAALEPLVAYGATSVLTVVTNTFVLYAQLGDGDLVSFDSDGQDTWPIPQDDRLFANETTSLCGREAWREFRVAFQPLENPPALILMSTDGYKNSFKSKEDFLKAGRDLLRLLSDDGIESVRNNLDGWLQDTSKGGSGDDITLGIVWPTTIVSTSPDLRGYARDALK